MSYGGGGIPFPGSQPQYVNPNAAYGAPQGQYGAPQAQFGASQGQFGASPGQYGGVPPAQYGGQMGGQMGLMPPTSAATAATADPYANAKPGTIAYAKSEGPDGIATYTPVIAQETTYNTPTGQIRGIKWVTATSSQASAAGIPPGAVTASNAAQLPQAAGMMPPMNLPGGIPPPGSAITAAGYPPGFGPGGGGFVPPGAGGFAPSPADEYPIMKPGMSQREYEKAVRKWEKNQDKERRAAEKRARKEEKERKQTRDWDRDAQDPYDITGGRGGERQRRMSTGGGLGFERARRMSGGAMLREDDLSRKLESLDMSFNSRRERKMSGGQAYAPSAAGGGFRSRKNSVSEAGGRDRRISGDYGQLPRTSFYPPAGAGIPGGGGYGAPVPGGYGAGARSMPGSPVRPHSAFPPSTHHDDIARGGPSPRPGTYYSRSRHASPSMGSTHLPGGYGGSTYGGARDPASASAYPYGTERTPYSTASNLPPAGGDSYALTRRPAGGAPSSLYPVSGRELNRAQPFTAFEEFFLVEDLNELMQPQPPPLPAALVPHDVMADEWDRCMHGLISLASQILQQQSSRSSALDPLIDLITQWNTTFFLPRGVDISIYKGNSRRSGPAMHPSALRSYDESESESESSSSSSSESSESEDDRYFSSARREQKAAKKAERKARRKERQRRRRARRRQRSVSIRIRAVPLH